MGYINKGGSGGGGILPDYSLSPIVYPRKWVNGNFVYEISVQEVLSSWGSNWYFLLSKTIVDTAAIIEHSFAYTDDGINWYKFDNFNVWSGSFSAFLHIYNPTPNQILVTGVIKYTLVEMPVLSS
ncbi:hypothetical protein [Raineya sp.]|jgi:hypothetical protein